MTSGTTPVAEPVYGAARMNGIRSSLFAATIALCLSTISLPAKAQTNGPASIKRVEAPDATYYYFNGKDFRGGQLVVPKLKAGAEDARRWVVVDVCGGRPPYKSKFGRRLLPLLGSDKVIALGPVLPNGYHMGDGEAAKQLIEHFEWIKQHFKVYDRMFLHGFSASAQFAHRFAFNHPELVVGVSAHSAGSWAGVEGWGDINNKARDIPFLLSCGELDTVKAFDGKAPHGRLDWMEFFSQQLKERGFVVRSWTRPKQGHGMRVEEIGPQLRECFLLATEGVKPEGGGWSGDIERIGKQARRVSEAADEVHRQPDEAEQR